MKACKDCPDRRLGCHAACERYEQDREDNQKKKDYLNRESRLYHSIDGERYDRITKALRRRWGRT